jgi:hypothetical protein
VPREQNALNTFAQQHYRRPLRLYETPIHGGLCSAVSRVRVRFLDAERPRTTAFIVKTVAGANAREVRLYQCLLGSPKTPFAPRLLGVDGARLYLEWVHASRRWPWTEEGKVELVLDLLAQIHETLNANGCLSDWDYESELAETAANTVEALGAAARNPEFARFRRVIPGARRLAARIRRMRRDLLGAERLAVLHGDAHPGNVLLRRTREPVLLDWARARLGSPLEDVSNWLQSLAFWEPSAHRRHDRLLRRYLQARGRSAALGTSFRELYWLARASNAFAGAMTYHLWRAAHPASSEADRWESYWAAWDWGRSLARADACWRA